MKDSTKFMMLTLLLCTTTVITCLIIRRMEPVSAQEKAIYLTFDDGPSADSSDRILAVLRNEHVHATFFVMGYRCRELPGTVRRMMNEGHEIGNHGYDHKNLILEPDSVVVSEITMADQSILRATGHFPVYYRPAYGKLTQSEINVVRKTGHKVVFWTVDSLDWKARDAKSIIRNVEGRARPGSIILLHDGIKNSKLTAQALPEIIHYYKEHGYVFRTL